MNKNNKWFYFWDIQKPNKDLFSVILSCIGWLVYLPVILFFIQLVIILLRFVIKSIVLISIRAVVRTIELIIKGLYLLIYDIYKYIISLPDQIKSLQNHKIIWISFIIMSIFYITIALSILFTLYVSVHSSQVYVTYIMSSSHKMLHVISLLNNDFMSDVLIYIIFVIGYNALVMWHYFSSIKISLFLCDIFKFISGQVIQAIAIYSITINISNIIRHATYFGSKISVIIPLLMIVAFIIELVSHIYLLVDDSKYFK